MIITKIGIIGSRRRNTDIDYQLTKIAFLDYMKQHQILMSMVIIVSGGCPKGGDRFAEMIAKEYNLPITIHHPDERKLKAKTRWAYAQICYERNTYIAKDSDVLIACVAEDRKGGIEDTIKKYYKFGKDKLVLI